MKTPTLPALAALLLAACSSTRHSVSGSTPPGAAMEVRVSASAPRVEIENEGPGLLRIEIDSPDDSKDALKLLGRDKTSFTAPGPLVLRIGPAGKREAKWRLRTFNATDVRTRVLVSVPR